MKLSCYALALTVLVASPPVFALNVGQPSHFVRTKRAFADRPLFGILDEINSDAFDLLKGSRSMDGGTSAAMNEAYEVLLAELVFSANDPRLDIIENYERTTDEKWLEWLKKKTASSTDPEEKVALRDLYKMILDVAKKLEVSKLAEESEAKVKQEDELSPLANVEESVEAGLSMSDSDVLRKAGAVSRSGLDTSGSSPIEVTKKSFIDSELTPAIRMSYDDLVQKLLPPYNLGDTPASIVSMYYDQFDAQLIKIMTERASLGDSDTQVVLEALSVEQQKRIAVATETLKTVLSMGNPMRMEGAIVKLAREGKVDEPFLLLLEANASQAAAAGANGPAQLMRKLRSRAMDEKDKQSSTKEVKLLRKLLRAENSNEREELLDDAFTPKEVLIVPGTAANAARAADGERPEEERPMPEVPPPDFINACKAVLLNFGNLSSDDDRGDLSVRIKQIASEAEVVATRIYGKGMSPREQQDRAWEEKTTSIFDLELMEINAERNGESAPWTNPNNDDTLPGFDKDGRMRIGGT